MRSMMLMIMTIMDVTSVGAADAAAVVVGIAMAAIAIGNEQAKY